MCVSVLGLFRFFFCVCVFYVTNGLGSCFGLQARTCVKVIGDLNLSGIFFFLLLYSIFALGTFLQVLFFASLLFLLPSWFMFTTIYPSLTYYYSYSFLDDDCKRFTCCCLFLTLYYLNAPLSRFVVCVTFYIHIYNSPSYS